MGGCLIYASLSNAFVTGPYIHFLLPLWPNRDFTVTLHDLYFTKPLLTVKNTVEIQTFTQAYCSLT